MFWQFLFDVYATEKSLSKVENDPDIGGTNGRHFIIGSVYGKL